MANHVLPVVFIAKSRKNILQPAANITGKPFIQPTITT
jgi:hypothetical protein